MIYDLIDQEPVDLTGESCITSLIDADSIIYLVGWNHKDHDNVDAVVLAVDQFIQDILVTTQARQYAGFFSDSYTYRHDIYPAYKAHRKDPHPGIEKWKPFIKEHCMDNWKFDLQPKLEADDAVALLQLNMLNTVLCSPDKDLKQVLGNHYDYKKNTKCHISEDQGAYNWAFQMLVGDSTDNIKGIPGCGPKKAEKLINGFMTREQLRKAVIDAYGVDTTSYKLHEQLIGMGCFGDLNAIRKAVHTFNLAEAVPSNYLRVQDDLQEAKDIFGDW